MLQFASGFALLLAAVQGDVYVADGATLVIDGTPIQIEGIDVPHPRSDAGSRAHQGMRDLLDGHVVTCRSTGHHAGVRVVAVCQAGGEDLGAAMVARGFALDCAAQSDGRYRSLEPAGSRERLVQSAACAPTEVPVP